MPLRQELPGSIRKLIGRALEQGYVTYDALNEAMPSDDYTNEEIEEITSMFSEKGIALLEAPPKEPAVHAKREIPRCCNFCGKNADESRSLIAGNNGHICADCISICMVVLAQLDRVWFDQKVEEARAFESPDLSDGT
jgi:hypothetical protein